MDESKKSPSSSSNDAALKCPACAREHGPDERFCLDCGMPLVHSGDESAEEARSDLHGRARKVRPEMTRGPLVRVAGGRNEAEADLIQNILLEEGVPSMAKRTAGFDVPDFLAGGPRDVLVPESGAETARAILHAAEIPVAPTPEAGATGAQAVRIFAVLLAAAVITALIAWALLQL